MKHFYLFFKDRIVSLAARSEKIPRIHKICFLSILIVSVSLSFCENIMEDMRIYNEIMEISSVSPVNSATGVSIGTDISASFTSDIDMSTVNSSTFSVNGGAVTGAFSYDPSTRTVVLTPASELLHNTLYTVNINQGLLNRDGKFISAPYSWTFTTAIYYFNILSVEPAAGEIGVPVTADIIVYFDDNINDTTLAGSILVDGVPDPTVGVIYDPVLRTATFNLTSDLSASTLHTITLTTGILNQSGETMAADYSWSFTTGILLAPEIYLLTPLGLDIITGDLYDFGNQINPGAWTKTFTIGNSGTGPLNISAVTLSDNVNYTTSLVPGTIAAGGSAAFTITFQPGVVAASTVMNSVFTINSNDSDESAFVINLTGLALSIPAPEIQITDTGVILVSPTSTMDFGTITINDTATKTLVIYNIGTAPLNITGTTIGGTDPSYYSTTYTTGVIAPGATANVDISFSAPVKANTRATITFLNNDADEGTFVVKLKGRTMP